MKDELDFCRQEEKRVEDSFGSLYAQRDSASTLQVSKLTSSSPESFCAVLLVKQGRIHGYLSRVRVGRSGKKKLSVTQRTNRQTEQVVESRARD